MPDFMKSYTVCFFGHRYITDFMFVEKHLEAIIKKLLEDKEYVEFLVGRNGDFDQLVSSTVYRCQRVYRNENSTHVLVLPYVTAHYRDNEKEFLKYYDEVEISTNASVAHFRAAIQVRNREMIDRSDLAVFFVEKEQGGAYQAYKYALQQNKKTINIAKLDEI